VPGEPKKEPGGRGGGAGKRYQCSFFRGMIHPREKKDRGSPTRDREKSYDREYGEGRKKKKAEEKGLPHEIK